jgi:hypothetical protein
LDRLDLSECKDLSELDCSDNCLTNLDLSNNSQLKKLSCSNNPLMKKLDLSSNLELTELNCYNDKKNTSISSLVKSDENDSRLSDIIFSPDFESFKLERINIAGNDKLDYRAIDKKFLKRLPEKLDYQIPAIDTQEFEQIIRERTNIHGEIKDIQIIPTW